MTLFSNRNLRFYRIKNCISAQIESMSFVSFRIGSTCAGIAMFPPFKAPDRKKISYYICRLFMPIFYMQFHSHTAQNDMMQLAGIGLFGFKLKLTTRGKLTDTNLHSWTSMHGVRLDVPFNLWHMSRQLSGKP